MNLLVFNAGSATLKFAVFEGAPPRCRMRGQVEHFGGATQLLLSVRGQTRSRRIKADNHAAAVAAILTELMMPQETAFDDRALVVGHRLVHGGARFSAPLRLGPQTLNELEGLAPLAPLHLPPALAVVRQVAATQGDKARQVAVFDTAYFHDLPPAARDYALPRERVERFGLRRYGFHGLAHQSLYAQFCEITRADPARVKVINFQLGHDCSAAAIEGGRAVDTSMGFTPLDGLVMGTRPGSVDPGLILHLLDGGIAPADVSEALNHRSGLLALSGASGDMRALLDLEGNGHAGAHAAIDSFCHAARKHLGAYLTVLGGADAVLFGGGIGEHAPSIRARICAGLEWAGLRLDAAANATPPPSGRISAAGSAIACHVHTVDEESVIARECQRALAKSVGPVPLESHAEITYASHS